MCNIYSTVSTAVVLELLLYVRRSSKLYFCLFVLCATQWRRLKTVLYREIYVLYYCGVYIFYCTRYPTKIYYFQTTEGSAYSIISPRHLKLVNSRGTGGDPLCEFNRRRRRPTCAAPR